MIFFNIMDFFEDYNSLKNFKFSLPKDANQEFKIRIKSLI